MFPWFPRCFGFHTSTHSELEYLVFDLCSVNYSSSWRWMTGVWGGSLHAWSLPSGHAQGFEGVGAWGELLEIGRSSAVFHGSRNRSGNHPCKLKNGTTFMVSASSFNTQGQHLGWSPLQRQDRQFRFGQKASWLLYSMLPSFLLPLVPTITQKNSTGDNLSQVKSKTV